MPYFGTSSLFFLLIIAVPASTMYKFILCVNPFALQGPFALATANFCEGCNNKSNSTT
jgi:hypothetical protein